MGNFTTIQKSALALMVLALAAIPVWLFGVLPELKTLPEDYNLVIELDGEENDRYKLDGEWGDRYLYRGRAQATTQRVESGVSLIQTGYRAETPDGTLLWETKGTHGVDRVTRRHVAGYGDKPREGLFLFAPDVKPQTQQLWSPMLALAVQATVEFVGEESIGGLAAYHFSGKVNPENTESFSWLELVPEQYAAFSDFTIDVWVEPVSGNLVKFHNDGISYYADKSTGRKVQDFAKWSNEWSSDTINNQVRFAQDAKQTLRLHGVILPVLFGGLALVMLVAVLLAGRLGRPRE